MKLQIVSVRDRAVDAYAKPFFVPSLGMAIRSFSDEINRTSPDNAMAQHPEDYDLYHLGTYTEETGIFETHTPMQIAIGNQVKLK